MVVPTLANTTVAMVAAEGGASRMELIAMGVVHSRHTRSCQTSRGLGIGAVTARMIIKLAVAEEAPVGRPVPITGARARTSHQPLGRATATQGGLRVAGAVLATMVPPPGPVDGAVVELGIVIRAPLANTAQEEGAAAANETMETNAAQRGALA